MTESRERRLLLLLAAVQFTHVLDFMVMLPLGPQLMRDLHMGPLGFSALLGCYSVASGVAGFFGSTFIDRFERRSLLVVTYLGFIVGTLGCALSHTAAMLGLSRSICGVFGGLCGSLVMTVASDLVPPHPFPSQRLSEFLWVWHWPIDSIGRRPSGVWRFFR
jgi:DHA1 family inner membrane transport protein